MGVCVACGQEMAGTSCLAGQDKWDLRAHLGDDSEEPVPRTRQAWATPRRPFIGVGATP
jgi:hypothetical protein